MEMILWITVGALAGAVAAVAFETGGGRTGASTSIAIGSVSALVGALLTDSVVGDVARVRVTIISGNSFSSVTFGLAPALAAATAAIVVLVSLQRVKHRSGR